MAEAPAPRRFELVSGETYSGWEEVYVDNVAGVYRLIFVRVGNRPDAEDLSEEVFLAALPRLRLPAPVQSVRAYLVATARTVLAWHWRHHYALSEIQVELNQLPAQALEEPSSASAERARSLLGRLPDRFRRILELRFLQGYSVREAAAEMGVSISNAKILQHRALRHAADLDSEVTR